MRVLQPATRLFSSVSVTMSTSSLANLKPSKPTLRGVIFDMDDTLTVPTIDFAEMYLRCGVDTSKDILQEVKRMESPQPALDIIEEMEETGREKMALMPGALEIQDWLRHHQVPIALVTRNSAKTVERLVQLGFKPDVAISRDDDFPHKPDPAALKHICSNWQLEASKNIIMVGDSVSNDVAFGKAGGISTLLLGKDSTCADGSDLQPDIATDRLSAIPQLIFEHFDIDSDIIRQYKPKAETPRPTTAAGKAAQEGDLDRLLVETEFLHAADETGNTPLIWAADAGHLHIVQDLLSNHCAGDRDNHINVQGYLKATAMNRAARRGYDDIVRVLAQAGASTEIPNERLQYPLHFAAFKRHPSTVETLLQCGASKWSFDRKGRTPADDTSDPAIRELILTY